MPELGVQAWWMITAISFCFPNMSRSRAGNLCEPAQAPHVANTFHPKAPQVLKINEMAGRGERIRTSDSCVPNAVLYQAELHPELIRNQAKHALPSENYMKL